MIMKNRTLVVGDIHGGLLALQDLVNKIVLTANDKLIFLGDYVDGWSQSPQVIDFLISLKTKHNCIFIRGNHDALVLDWLENNNKHIDEGMWYKHGGEATVVAYKLETSETKSAHIAFLKSLVNYHVDDHNRLFVHAGFTNMNGVQHEYFPKLLYWDRTLWETAICIDKNIDKESPFYPARFKLYNEIFIGHTPVTKIGKTTPLQYANVWNIDTGAAFKGPLTIIDADSKEYWQSKPLNLLYPTEKGRN